MTVKELKKYLESLPDDIPVKFTTYRGVSPDWVDQGPDEMEVMDIGLDTDDKESKYLQIHLG